MLLKVYYLYEKSPKMCRELEEVVSELKTCLKPHEFPEKGGEYTAACMSHKVVQGGCHW